MRSCKPTRANARLLSFLPVLWSMSRAVEISELRSSKALFRSLCAAIVALASPNVDLEEARVASLATMMDGNNASAWSDLQTHKRVHIPCSSHTQVLPGQGPSPLVAQHQPPQLMVHYAPPILEATNAMAAAGPLHHCPLRPEALSKCWKTQLVCLLHFMPHQPQQTKVCCHLAQTLLVTLQDTRLPVCACPHHGTGLSHVRVAASWASRPRKPVVLVSEGLAEPAIFASTASVACACGIVPLHEIAAGQHGCFACLLDGSPASARPLPSMWAGHEMQIAQLDCFLAPQLN